MAGYCSQCSPYKIQGSWDFDLFQIALQIKPGHSESFICEGCANRGIYKDENNCLHLAKQERDGEIKLYPVSIDELLA